MQLRADAKLPFPRSRVFEAYRDKLVDLLPYLPNVRKIEVKSREENGDVVKLLNVWHGGGEIPAAARAVLSEKMLQWDDHAIWNAADFTTSWVIKTHSFSEAVKCEGSNRYLDDNGQTVLEIRGVLEIDAKRIRGVPGFLAGKVGKTVEEFLVGKIQPNLVETVKGLQKYLESQAKT